MTKRQLQPQSVVLVMVFLTGFGCDQGNTADGRFSVRGTQQETFDVVDTTSLVLTTLRVEEAPVIAVGGTIDVSVGDANFWTRPLTKIASASVDDPSILALDVVGDTHLTVEGLARGDVTLDLQAAADGEEASDSMQVMVRAPDELRMSPGCQGSWVYWAGMPAVVRYQMQSEDGQRVFGRGVFPFETEELKHRADESTAWDWVFDTPTAAGTVEVRGALKALHGTTPRTETLGLEPPPPIGGVRFVNVVSGQVMNGLSMTPDNEALIRAVPVAADGKIMCNTFLRGRFESSHARTCVVRSGNQADFAENSSPETAHLSVRALEPGGCRLSFTPDLDGLDVVGDAAELVAELSVGVVWASSFASGSGSGGGMSFDD